MPFHPIRPSSQLNHSQANETSFTVPPASAPVSDLPANDSPRATPACSNQIPHLSRNRWSRPDLARVMNAESDHAPYITPSKRFPAEPDRFRT
jgi:hypothetical protein